jgi:hypothetical protein
LQSDKETIELDKAVFTHPDDPVPYEVSEESLQAILASRVAQA